MHKQIKQFKILKENNGITLIALVITIIVLLILAGVSIAMLTSTGNIIQKARNAKDNTEIAREKEQIQLAVAAVMESEKNNIIEKSKLNEELSKYNATIVSEDENSYYIKYNDSQRYYRLDKNGNLELLENVTEKKLTVQCVNSKNDILQEETYIIITDNYKEELPKINDYTSFEDTISGEITEDTVVSHLYYKILDDDTELVFTGLDSSGNITTVEEDIVSYMIGDNTKSNANGLKETEISSILRIPEKYKEKNVTKIPTHAFYQVSNIFKAYVPASVKVLETESFGYCKNLEYIYIDAERTKGSVFWVDEKLKKVDIGKNVKGLDGTTFWKCPNLEDVTIYTEQADINAIVFNWEVKALKEFKVNEGNSKYTVDNGILFSENGTRLCAYPPGKTEEYEFPSTVTVMNDFAFCGNNHISQIIIPSSIEKIPTEAFYACGNLGYAMINSKSIGTYAFEVCSNLRKVDIGTNVTEIQWRAFSRCTNIEEFNYKGTIDQWNQIKKDGGWASDTSITSVICTNGTINLNE